MNKLDNGMQMQGRQLVRHSVFMDRVFKDRIEKLMFAEIDENRKFGDNGKSVVAIGKQILRAVFHGSAAATVSILLTLIVGLAAYQQAFAQETGIPTKSLPDYPAVGKRAGVWNDGLAALWDLHVLDHYKYFGPPQRAEGYAPEQPINFSHIVHVQQNKMECQYCHWNVSKGSYAALPDVDTCMGCHKIVGGRDEASTAEIQKLRDLHAKGQPIEWLKVHVMPDHYKFNHKRHVKGGVACHECHGQVPEMAKVERVSSMKMGWCLDCHRMRGASIDCATCHY
jgi:hypothetical protein